jgi:AraC family transcriptional regulator
VFKNTFGCTPHQYVLNRRVARAQLLVIKGELPLNEVALEAGFSHQSHMAAAFRREFGCTPGQMRRALVE